mmetsp:Transcript_39042/g.34723  ORF Transcript_39042/g.34723 Transcript_39042/m.34723 type:complete len:237 (-) Transcript_39042:1416-2126(-)
MGRPKPATNNFTANYDDKRNKVRDNKENAETMKVAARAPPKRNNLVSTEGPKEKRGLLSRGPHDQNKQASNKKYGYGGAGISREGSVDEDIIRNHIPKPVSRDQRSHSPMRINPYEGIPHSNNKKKNKRVISVDYEEEKTRGLVISPTKSRQSKAGESRHSYEKGGGISGGNSVMSNASTANTDKEPSKRTGTKSKTIAGNSSVNSSYGGSNLLTEKSPIKKLGQNGRQNSSQNPW